MRQLIKDFPAYSIDRNGNVYSRFKPKTNILTDEWFLVKPVMDRSNGYLLVTLCTGTGIRKNKRIHRLLMETFVPNPLNLPQINHIDGNKLNNCLDNLEWCSAKHNSEHAAKLGLIDERTKTISRSVLQYDKEGNLISEFPSIHEAGRLTNICWQNISKVVRGIRPYAGSYYWKYK